jgi:vacuolar-type H+-ATPase subunit E/Vma4
MATSSLFETMTRQVEAECAGHLAKARAEAERILADARAKAVTSRDATLATARAEVDRLDVLWKQKTEAESVRLELAMENDAVEAVLEKVRAEMTRVAAGPEFPGLLSRLLDELIPAIPSGDDVELLGPAAHIEHIRQLIGTRGKQRIEVKASDQFQDGVAAQDRARTWRISNTLHGRFQHMEQAARKHCMTTLFGSKGR